MIIWYYIQEKAGGFSLPTTNRGQEGNTEGYDQEGDAAGGNAKHIAAGIDLYADLSRAAWINIVS